MVEEAQTQAVRRQSHRGSAMVGFWFLEKAPNRKDREKGELSMGEMKKRKKKLFNKMVHGRCQ